MEIIQTQSGLTISGELTFRSTRKLWEASKPFFVKFKKDFKINLEQITHCDSAGLALLIEWKRLAKKQNKSILFENLPEQLINMARLSGVEKLL